MPVDLGGAAMSSCNAADDLVKCFMQGDPSLGVKKAGRAL